MLDVISFTFLTLFMGFRHGFDSDHVAAIADMVGGETQRSRQLRLGFMYAIGHGAIVLAIGLLAIILGSRLPESFLSFMEAVVGVSLLVLGVFILWTVIYQKNHDQYQSRLQLICHGINKMFRRKTESGVELSKWGIAGAFAVGILHGIGAETPTQVMLISSSVGLNNLFGAILQISLFTAGILCSTLLITFIASWGFMKSRWNRMLYIILGTVTGLYSIFLGISIMSGS